MQNRLPKEQALELLKVVMNSSQHLSSLIDDTLDISRLENNKFQIVKGMFNLTCVTEEISEIMSFQTS